MASKEQINKKVFEHIGKASITSVSLMLIGCLVGVSPFPLNAFVFLIFLFLAALLLFEIFLVFVAVVKYNNRTHLSKT